MQPFCYSRICTICTIFTNVISNVWKLAQWTPNTTDVWCCRRLRPLRRHRDWRWPALCRQELPLRRRHRVIWITIHFRVGRRWNTSNAILFYIYITFVPFFYIYIKKSFFTIRFFECVFFSFVETRSLQFDFLFHLLAKSSQSWFKKLSDCINCDTSSVLKKIMLPYGLLKKKKPLKRWRKKLR